MTTYLEIFSFVSILAPIIVWAVIPGKLSKPFYFILWLFIFGAIIEVLNRTIPIENYDNFYYAIFFPVEFALVCLFFIKRFELNNKWVYVCAITILIYIGLVVEYQGLSVFYPSLRLMLSMPLIFLAMHGFVMSLQEKDRPTLMVSVAFMVYFTVSIIPILAIGYYDATKVWAIHSVVNIIMNLLIGGAFYGNILGTRSVTYRKHVGRSL